MLCKKVAVHDAILHKKRIWLGIIDRLLFNPHHQFKSLQMKLQGCVGGDWGLRVAGEVINASLPEGPQRVSLLFYIADSQVT